MNKSASHLFSLNGPHPIYNKLINTSPHVPTALVFKANDEALIPLTMCAKTQFVLQW